MIAMERTRPKEDAQGFTLGIAPPGLEPGLS